MCCTHLTDVVDVYCCSMSSFCLCLEPLFGCYLNNNLALDQDGIECCIDAVCHFCPHSSHQWEWNPSPPVPAALEPVPATVCPLPSLKCVTTFFLFFLAHKSIHNTYVWFIKERIYMLSLEHHNVVSRIQTKNQAVTQWRLRKHAPHAVWSHFCSIHTKLTRSH